MIGLSLGSLPFCRALFRARLVPRPLAACGFGGYALLAPGGVLELLGHRVGLLLSAAGGLFEATLGVLLLVKGFPEIQSQDIAAAYVPEPADRIGLTPALREASVSGQQAFSGAKCSPECAGSVG